MVVGRAFACTAYYELPYLVSSSSRSFIAYRLAKFGVQKLVRNSIIALFSQAKQSIIGARFSSTNFTFLRRKGSLDRLDRKPRDDFSAPPTSRRNSTCCTSVLNNKSQWWLAVHSRARPTANFHTWSLVHLVLL
jgi:hypothetical protein